MNDIVERLRKSMSGPRRDGSTIAEEAANVIENLRASIKLLGEVGNICTYDILKEICVGCRCKRGG